MALNFASILNASTGSAVEVGDAVRLAKQRYFNSIGPGGLSNYDEKVLAIWTLYGLPMRAVSIPARPGSPEAAPVGREVAAAANAEPHAAGEISNAVAVTRTITPDLRPVTRPNGAYYTVAGETQALFGRPIEPRMSIDISNTPGLAHGVLIVGGRTRDLQTDPVITRVATDMAQLAEEPNFDSPSFFPGNVAAINRLLRVEGDIVQRLVLVPGQFRATSASPTTAGIQRLWERLDVVTYHAPFDNTDFTTPSIWAASASLADDKVSFTVEATDAGEVNRAVILYRRSNSNEWHSLDLSLIDSSAGKWTGSLTGGARVRIEWVAQVVDEAGNVAWQDDYGSPFAVGTPWQALYLPRIQR